MNEHWLAALLAYGYRPLNDSKTKWAKPVGSNLFVINLDEKVMRNHFWSGNNKFLVWNSESTDGWDVSNQDTIISHIMNYEEFNFHSMSMLSSRNISFLTKDDQIKIWENVL